MKNKRNHQCTFTIEEENIIIGRYLNGETSPDIANTLSCKDYTIRRILAIYNIPRRKPKKAQNVKWGVKEVFWDHIKEEENGCWSFKGSLDKYRDVYYNSKHYGAHRFSYILHYGKYEKGLCICHKCDNKGCVNPDHLFLGTQKDNMDDMWNKGRGNPPINKGEKNGSSKLTEKEVIQIKENRKMKSVAELSILFSISKSTIRDIYSNRTWKCINLGGHAIKAGIENIGDYIHGKKY